MWNSYDDSCRRSSTKPNLSLILAQITLIIIFTSEHSTISIPFSCYDSPMSPPRPPYWVFCSEKQTMDGVQQQDKNIGFLKLRTLSLPSRSVYRYMNTSFIYESNNLYLLCCYIHVDDKFRLVCICIFKKTHKFGLQSYCDVDVITSLVAIFS